MPPKPTIKTPNVVCEICAKAVYVRPCQLPTARFCSRACANLGHRVPLDERFWAKVTKTDRCWLWNGAGSRSSRGYGRIQVARKPQCAHRIAWELVNGPIPDGMFICHHCDTPQCVRPDHLFLGTASDNTRDMTAKGRGNHSLSYRPELRFKGVIPPERVARGEKNGMAKMTAEQVREIRQRYTNGGVTQKALAREYATQQSCISMIVLRKSWKHIE